jgi:hypothetical protein
MQAGDAPSYFGRSLEGGRSFSHAPSAVEMVFEQAQQALERVNANIRAGNERLRQQAQRIEEMLGDGIDAALALRVLAIIRDARDASVLRRELILERIMLAAQRRRCRLPVAPPKASGTAAERSAAC